MIAATAAKARAPGGRPAGRAASISRAVSARGESGVLLHQLHQGGELSRPLRPRVRDTADGERVRELIQDQRGKAGGRQGRVDRALEGLIEMLPGLGGGATAGVLGAQGLRPGAVLLPAVAALAMPIASRPSTRA